MKYSLIALLLACGMTTPLTATRYYVSSTGSATTSGLSWSAATTLERALDLATSGDEVWARQGVYTLRKNDRSASFVLPAGVRLRGGFTGTEARAADRPRGYARTVLSGELGVTGDLQDNAYTVVKLLSNAAAPSLLEGFTIREGSARNYQDGFRAGSAGGGLWIAAPTSGSPAHQIVNCAFRRNTAHNGGAVYLAGGQPRFTNCIFMSNTADYNGGAVYNDGRQYASGPIFDGCSFVNNASKSGGALTNNGAHGEAVILVKDSEFRDNVVQLNGAAVYNCGTETGTADAILEGCSFSGNETVLGDVIASDAMGDVIVAGPSTTGTASTGGRKTLAPGRRKLTPTRKKLSPTVRKR